MLTHVNTLTFNGLEIRRVDLQAQISSGLPNFIIVGLPDKAIAEIEMSDEHTEIVFPKQIKVIKEVTDDDSFRNASLAQIKE